MINKEFSDNFSTLLNSFDTLPGIELDEYEKSVFLTAAQEEIILELYTGNNNSGRSFEQTEEIRRHLDSLLTSTKGVLNTTLNNNINNDSCFFDIPKDIWFIVYEQAILKDIRLTCGGTSTALVVPTTYDSIYKIKDNPFKGPNKDRVLRLDVNNVTKELFSKYKIEEYLIKYIKQPKPIILIDLPDGLSINGIKTESECELNPVVHRPILNRAVQLAVISKTKLTGKE